jgi:hypothetical protein
MGLPHVLLLILVAAFFIPYPPAHASETIVVAEGRYVMGDSDTLAMAEERVLRLAQRRAVEEAGLYIESIFHDTEEASTGKSFQSSTLEVRTIAAAITKTDILESRRFFDNDRPSFYIRIRAVVDLDNLQAAVQRWQSEQRFPSISVGFRAKMQNSRLSSTNSGPLRPVCGLLPSSRLTI